MLQSLIASENPYPLWSSMKDADKKRIAAILEVPKEDVLGVLPLLKYAATVSIPEPVNQLEYE